MRCFKWVQMGKRFSWQQEGGIKTNEFSTKKKLTYIYET